MTSTGTRGLRVEGWGGEPVPERFSMARYCLGVAAANRPDAVGLTVVHDVDAPADEAEHHTFAELDLAARAVGAGLRALGLGRGERVLLRLHGTSAFPIAHLGAMSAGLVPVPTSAMLTPDEAGFVLADSGARAVALADDLQLEVPAGVHVVRPADLDAWVADARRNPAAVPDHVDTAADDPAFLVYTSGTTGRPKGVLHAHRSAWGRRPMRDGWLGIGPDDVMLHAGTLSWTYTLGVGLTDPWAVGARAVVLDGPRRRDAWDRLVRDHGATLFAAVPGVYRQWLEATDGPLDLGSLRHGLAAGEPLAPDLLTAWRQRTGLELYEAFGMSEISTFVSTGPGVPVRPGSPGRAQPGRRIGVLDPEVLEDPQSSPVELSVGDVGRLAVNREDPGLMLGYWQRPDETAEVMRGEWFVTGDLAEVDADGYLTYHGRADDVMNAMGYRVSPVEVEEALAGVPGVAEVAVAALDLGDGVGIVCAWVVPTPDVTDRDAVRAEVVERAAGQLAAYKRPREVRFADALPRTANGKVVRRDLG